MLPSCLPLLCQSTYQYTKISHRLPNLKRTATAISNMSSHGIPRSATREQRTAEAREKELREIEQYRSLVNQIQEGVANKDFSPGLLDKTSALLKRNPEYYTIWNIRRRIFDNEFQNLSGQVATGSLTQDVKNSQVLDIVNLDLQFLFPLLLHYPKCYWIWNHRLWLLEQGSLLLPAHKARSLWQDELKLVGKMLTRDNRNFHGWGYRRTVVDKLESPSLNGETMCRSEYEYTTKMIKQNLSNFSAWHNRSRLILQILDEEKASDEERKKMLEDEIELVHEALIDPYDQSIWFYHQNIMSTFDPAMSQRSMAPALSNVERLEYVKAEQAFIDELLEEAEDSKWVYQALMECALLEADLTGTLSAEVRTSIKSWLAKVRELDPLRTGRWKDMEYKLLGGG